MIRIAGIILKPDQTIVSALSTIYGIGRHQAQKITDKAGIKHYTRVKDVPDADILTIRKTIEDMTVEGDLRSDISQNIKRLKEIGTLRGVRHTRNLPVRGQRTKTNARTKRGKKVTVGSGRKKAAEKT